MMKITSVELFAQPMVYVTARASMRDIPASMGAAFKTLEQFLGTSGAKPLGPPLAIYHDWSGDMTAFDVGFPVSSGDAKKASGDVLAGTTPGGYALRIVHVGPYDELPATYAAIGTAMHDAGIPESSRMFEVYVSDPSTASEAGLVTEIYTQVSAEDAAKFPREPEAPKRGLEYARHYK